MQYWNTNTLKVIVAVGVQVVILTTGSTVIRGTHIIPR